MQRFLYISPAIVAIVIFLYMRNVQSRRNNKLKERFKKRDRQLIQMLSSKKDKTENDNEQ